MDTGGGYMWARLSPRVRVLLGVALVLMVLVAIMAVGAFAHLHGLGATVQSVADTNVWHNR